MHRRSVYSSSPYYNTYIASCPGLATNVNEITLEETQEAEDGKPFLILNYANGPGFKSHRMEGEEETFRRNLTGENTTGQFLQYVNTYTWGERESLLPMCSGLLSLK